MKRLVFACLTTLALVGLARPAAAHTVLTIPAPLTGDDDAKAGPCGCYFGGGPEDPAEDGTPLPCPADFPVTTLEAGTELTIEWKETVNHAGSFRFAFSPKPPDQTAKADVDANILMDIPDENATSGATLTQKITVPSEPCELCVLQLRQFMMNAGQPYYYSCAAVKIVAPVEPTTSSSGAGGAGGAGVGGSGAGASGQGASPPINETVSSGAGYADPEPEIPAGCSTSPSGVANAGALAILGLAIAAGALRKARGRRLSG